MNRLLHYAYLTDDLQTFRSLLQSSQSSLRVRQELNKKDWKGCTLLHIAATDGKVDYLTALLNHPAVDSRLQDEESRWTALHRALYHGKLECGMVLLRNNWELLKIKDREGYSAFDVFNSTIDGTGPLPFSLLGGTDLFTFGSNANFNLGFPNNDDRAHPERVLLPPMPSNQFKDQRILDVQMSKLHTIVLTVEPRSNIYVCGFGNHGRLGLPSGKTHFKITALPGISSHVSMVALSQDHTLALTSSGTLYSWGSNAHGQLGYHIEKSGGQEPPIQPSPRKVIALKRERIIGCAVSRVHSVAWTETETFTWGRNQGQLGYPIDPGETTQTTPRKVASLDGKVVMVAAIEKATSVLTHAHDVIVCMNEGLFKLNLSFQLNRFSNKISLFRPRASFQPNQISKISSGGATILAITSMGDVFKISFSSPHLSTLRPSQLSKQITPIRIVSLRRKPFTFRDAAVGQDDSILVCTLSGSVWKRVREGISGRGAEWKFKRVPGITRAVAVRGTTSGAYAVIRDDVRLGEVNICQSSFIQDLMQGSVFQNLISPTTALGDEYKKRLQMLHQKAINLLLDENYLEAITDLSYRSNITTDCHVAYGHIRLPVHQFVLAARSTTLRSTFVQNSSTSDLALIDEDGLTIITFVDIHLPSLFILLYYLYTDHLLRPFSLPEHLIPSHLRHTKAELTKLSILLNLSVLQKSLASSYSHQPPATLHANFLSTILNSEFEYWANTVVVLSDSHIEANSFILSARSSFFEATISDTWVAYRMEKKVDMSHISSKVFNIVLRYIYGDELDTLFDSLDFSHVDEFTDFVVDVMNCADELLLDRLKEKCESLLREYVTFRSMISRLTEADRCGANQLKNACLEYCIINGEAMMESRFFDELEWPLIQQLEGKLCELQRRRFPNVRTNIHLESLHAKYPALKFDILQEHERFKQELKALPETGKSAFLGLFAQCKEHYNSSLNHKRSHTDLHSRQTPIVRLPCSDEMFKLDSDLRELGDSEISWRINSHQDVSLKNHIILITQKGPDKTNPLHSSFRLNVSKEKALVSLSSAPSGIAYVKSVLSESRSEVSGSLRNVHWPGLYDTYSSPHSSPKHKEGVWGKPLVTSIPNLKSTFTDTSPRTKEIDPRPCFLPVRNGPIPVKLSQRQRKRQSVPSLTELSPISVLQRTTVVNHNTVPPWKINAADQKTAPIYRTVPEGDQSASLPSIKIPFRNNMPSQEAVAQSEPESFRLSKSEPRHSLFHVSLTDVIFEQQRESNHLQSRGPKQTLKEIQEQETFEKWFEMESKKVQEERARIHN
ncbi:BTB/POZ domain-containing protein 1, partial [Neolecta irregularis DAH-3]